MAEIGENYIKEVFEAQGYLIENIKDSGIDIFGTKENIGVVIEEKDWKDPVKILRNKIYQRGINGKWYYHNKRQVANYCYLIRQKDAEDKKYRFIISAFVFSNLIGRLVQPIFFAKFGVIFCIHKSYFPIWLKSLERTYLGEQKPEIDSMYMGGK